MSERLGHGEKISHCAAATEKLVREVIDELAALGVYAERVISLKSVNGVLQATVTRTDQYRFDISTK